MKMIEHNHFICHYYWHFSVLSYIGTFSKYYKINQPALNALSMSQLADFIIFTECP